MEKSFQDFKLETDDFGMDTALLSPFLTFDSKPLPTGLCPLTPSLIPTTSIDHSKSYLGSALGSAMLIPVVTPVLGPLTPGQLLHFPPAESYPSNIKSKFYSLFPNYKKNQSLKTCTVDKPDLTKLSHKEAEQRRRDEFKEKLASLRQVLTFKKHASSIYTAPNNTSFLG